MDCSQTIVWRPRAVATVEFEMLKKLPQEGNVEIFDEQFGRRPPEVLTAKSKQSSKGISVSRYGILACPELLYQSAGIDMAQAGGELRQFPPHVEARPVPFDEPTPPSTRLPRSETRNASVAGRNQDLQSVIGATAFRRWLSLDRCLLRRLYILVTFLR
jgi:hypothetical protein